ncbi:MAG: helix-turn-helix domain-containing protein [Flavobacteriaceae bacterium]|nr:helix-turn-helix domain-containing protein [Flavobacteriaceae bacterium]
METLKYVIIKTKKQYNEYCNTLENLVMTNNKVDSDEIDLLNLLIEKWDSEHNSFNELNPVELLKTLMETNNLKSKDLVEILELSKGTVSKILSSQKGLSKETIRKLSDYFNVSQEAFNRPYKLINEINRHFRDASLMNTKKHFKKVLA